MIEAVYFLTIGEKLLLNLIFFAIIRCITVNVILYSDILYCSWVVLNGHILVVADQLHLTCNNEAVNQQIIKLLFKLNSTLFNHWFMLSLDFILQIKCGKTPQLQNKFFLFSPWSNLKSHTVERYEVYVCDKCDNVDW